MNIKLIKNIYVFVVELLALPIVLLAAIWGRFQAKPVDVGLGPEPLINNVYHKKALTSYGYSAETFVNDVFFITGEFDVRGDTSFFGRHTLLRPWIPIHLFVQAVSRYKCLYIYFNGGPLLNRKFFLWRLEPFLYKLACVKIVVMPYGGDVQDLARTSNLLFKDAMSRDYPQFRHRRRRIIQQIDLWTRHADHIIAGCDWVEYLYHWDTLMLAHFSIDLEMWRPNTTERNIERLRVLHAPNHRTIKGTHFFLQAIDELQQEGVPIELVLLERVPNSKVREVMASVDVVADQLIIGWYAMFALEAMSMEKPVLCYLRDELKNLYIGAGLVKADEIPILNCSHATVKETLRQLATMDRSELRALGQRSRAYVNNHHSLDTVGNVFDRINRSLSIVPSNSVAM